VLLFIVCLVLISFVHCIVCPLTVIRQTVAFMAFCAMIYNDILCVIYNEQQHTTIKTIVSNVSSTNDEE
jgi:hypothetical protein